MRLHTRSISGLAVAVSLSVAVVASAPASSGLNPNWTLFNETTNAPLTSSDVIDASGSETFQGDGAQRISPELLIEVPQVAGSG